MHPTQFDVEQWKRMIHELHPTQDAITRVSKYALEHPVAASLVFELMLEEATNVSSQRLPLFYLFNEVIQISARKRLVSFLEAGAGIFIPGFNAFVLRLALSERKPYLRTLEIWRERSVYSTNFLNKLEGDWKSGGDKVELSPRKRKRTTVETIQTVEAVTMAGEAEKENDERVANLNKKMEAIFQDQSVPVAAEQIPNLLHELKQMEQHLLGELKLVTSAIIKLSSLKS